MITRIAFISLSVYPLNVKKRFQNDFYPLQSIEVIALQFS